MNIIKNIKVPTGNICIANGDNGKLEFLSIGDYGKEKNLKADFLGLTNKINGVPHGDLLSLEKKWVVTISSQYGCSMNCNFCDVPKVGKGINATFNDLLNQVFEAINLHKEISYTKRLNLHYARMGEPTFNFDVINSAYYLTCFFKRKEWGFHPVVSTMMPFNNKNLYFFIKQWVIFKNNVYGNAGLQLSINTTDEEKRKKTMPFSSSLKDISIIMNKIIKEVGYIQGRKITLNFALTTDDIDSKILKKLFDPKFFLCKITPMHMTNSCIKRNIITNNGYNFYYPYEKIENELKESGFDVIVFIPSKEEDESRITCGNAILSNNDISFKSNKSTVMS